MDWAIEFYGKVEEELAKLPPKIQARMIRLMELMEKHGANLGELHTKYRRKTWSSPTSD